MVRSSPELPQISELEFGRILHLGPNSLRLSIITESQNIKPVCLSIKILDEIRDAKKSIQISNNAIPGVGPLEILEVHPPYALNHVATRLTITTRFRMVIQNQNFKKLFFIQNCKIIYLTEF